MTKDRAPGRTGSAVSLAPVTADSVREVLALEVAPEQRHCVASTARAIAEAHFNKGACFWAIEADGVAVGFVSLFDPTLPGATPREGVAADEILLWRLMIDRRFQGQRLATKALDLIREQVRGRPGVRRLIASFVPGPHGPEAFYMRYGFAKTGRVVAEGTEIEICITP